MKAHEASSPAPAATARIWAHPLVFAGAALSLSSVFLILVVMGLATFAAALQSLAGLLIDASLLVLFVVGLLCIGLGAWLYRRARRDLPVRWVVDWSLRRDRTIAAAIAALALLTVVAVVGAAHSGITYIDTTSFCADVCHDVMAPQANPHRLSSHAKVTCAECHIAPGVGGYLRAKLRGARELWHQVRGDYHRPLIAADLTAVPDPGVCSRCHDPERPYGRVPKTFPSFAGDEKNTPTPTTLQLNLGSPASGVHHHIAMKIRYFSTDGGKSIQQVVLTRPDGRRVEFAASGTPPAHGTRGVWRKMDCITCHNRTGHAVIAFERRVDEAMAAGALPAADPGLKKRLMDAAGPQDPIPSEPQYRETLRKLQEITRSDAKLSVAGSGQGTVSSLYAASVFPSMKVGSGTYPNYIGHEGCFRCHGPMGPIGAASTEPAPPTTAASVTRNPEDGTHSCVRFDTGRKQRRRKAMTRTTRPRRLSRVPAGLLTAALVAGLAGAGLAAPDLKAGKALFSKHCLACHTPDGKAKMRGAPDLSSKAVQSKISDERMTQVVLNGTPHMPGYKKLVSQADATNLIAYVRTLGK